MINEVRETVMAILSKDNNGYITPHEFNLFAKQAQLDIFEDYMSRHQRNTVATNLRQNNTGDGDRLKSTQELIDRLSSNAALTNDTGSNFILPSNYFSLQDIYYGTAHVEYVSKAKLIMLNNSKLTAPSAAYPAYTFGGQDSSDRDLITIYPTSITSGVSAFYVRYPSDPKWTYATVGGNPLFNASALDYQDFELPLQDFNDLVIKICAYAGMNIREAEIVQAMAGMDQANKMQGE